MPDVVTETGERSPGMLPLGSESILVNLESGGEGGVGPVEVGPWELKEQVGETEWTTDFAVAHKESGLRGLLRLAGDNPEAHVRFAIEKAVLVAGKPNEDGAIPCLLDSGTWRDWRGKAHHWLVRAVVGEPLDKTLRPGPNTTLTFSKLMGILRQLFAALEELHGLGFVLRSVHPAAFAVSSATESSRIFIVDFLSAAKINDRLDEVRTEAKLSPAALELQSPRLGLCTDNYGPVDDLAAALLLILQEESPGRVLPWTGLPAPEMAWLKWATPASILASSSTNLATLYNHLRNPPNVQPLPYAAFQDLIRSAANI